MNFTELKERLQAMSRQQANELAVKANVPPSTVAKIRKGHTEHPRVTTVEALLQALSTSGKGKRSPRKEKPLDAFKHMGI